MATALPPGPEPVTEVLDAPVNDRACTVHVLQPRRGSDVVLAQIDAAFTSASGPTLPVVTLPGDAGSATGSILAALRAAGGAFPQIVNIQSLADDGKGLTTLALAETEPVDGGPPAGYA